jgi:hypothetical protein
MKNNLFSAPLAPSHHCVTGSMWRIFQWAGYPISEEMLLGLGEGLGFIYWQAKGMDPFLGGRTNSGRPGEEGLEKTAARRLGVGLQEFQSGVAEKGQRHLQDSLRAGRPQSLQVDMGFLPYFHWEFEYHFGGHVVAACGLDEDAGLVYIADRETKIYPVPYADLTKARNSQYKPFQPRQRSVTFDFSGFHAPEPDEVLAAIRPVVKGMLHAPITNLGVRGIHKAADRIRRWPQDLDQKSLANAVFNLFIFVDATGGTGGGIFRYMYGRFLQEAAGITGVSALAGVGDDLKLVADRWQEVALLGHSAYESGNPADCVEDISRRLIVIAEAEQAAWEKLEVIVKEN